MLLLSVLRVGASRAGRSATTLNHSLAISGRFLTPIAAHAQSKATITSKQNRKPRDVRPFPYQTEKYSYWRYCFDDTLSRIDENSRIIVVEGNIASGKSTLAKKIAAELDFYHFPEACVEMLYVDKNGFDLRSLNDKVPELCRHFDISDFYKKPKSPLTPDFQYKMFQVRTEQYMDAMAHVLNTGQGVVLERSPYSDHVFMDTMYKFGYVTKEDYEIYMVMMGNTLMLLLKPHLMIYLDAPLDVLQQRIKKRNLPYEVNTSVLSKEYLQNIDELYKQNVLRKAKEHGELLIYDWSKFGDTDVVIEDIERVPLDALLEDIHEPKLLDWKKKTPGEWDDIRYDVTTGKRGTIHTRILNVERFNHQNLIASPEDIDKYNEVFEKYVPEYDVGFEPKGANNGWLFRLDANYRDRISMARTRLGAD